MCGIVAYLGHREASQVIIGGLKRLEYRGYDSTGIALLTDDTLAVYKKKGKVAELEHTLQTVSLAADCGIGHTRWATHGEPTDANSHPHLSNNGRFALVHNGIIENYSTLKKSLLSKGYTFASQTDTEVLVNFIESIQNSVECTTYEAIRIALLEVVGAYAICLLDREEPNQLYVARNGSPLAIGVGEGEFFVASDASPIVAYTKNVIYLDDQEIAKLDRTTGLEVFSLDNTPRTPFIETIELELEAIEKGGYEHFMLKEIYEQPRTILDCMRGRIDRAESKIVLGGLRDFSERLTEAKRIIIVACGTSWHAGLVAEYLIEELARIPVEVEYASEFRYRNPIIYEGDIVLAISQSGETADTLAALEIAKSKGAYLLGVCNVVGSSIARLTHAGVYTHAGPEIGVASTKAFTAQVTVLILIALSIAQGKQTLAKETFERLLQDLGQVPDQVEHILSQSDEIKEMAKMFTFASNFIFLGRGINFPVALEGALKLKEISYIHAEGYPAAEMKHGPIALIDDEMPVVFVATKDSSYEKVVSNIQEVKARKGRIIAIISEGDELIPSMVDFVIKIPQTHEVLQPLLSVIPLQLLSYHIAVLRGRDVDQPRNLAKSVTVE
jgi:glucosamine--fructose-6-phosphate aminotransferase (isomerizing)